MVNVIENEIVSKESQLNNKVNDKNQIELSNREVYEDEDGIDKDEHFYPYFNDKDIENKPYIIINNKVYNVGEFTKKHPGGKEVLTTNFGKDCTYAFTQLHSAKTKKWVSALFVGYYDKT